jgi:hypothetical protein
MINRIVGRVNATIGPTFKLISQTELNNFSRIVGGERVSERQQTRRELIASKQSTCEDKRKKKDQSKEAKKVTETQALPGLKVDVQHSPTVTLTSSIDTTCSEAPSSSHQSATPA